MDSFTPVPSDYLAIALVALLRHVRGVRGLQEAEFVGDLDIHIRSQQLEGLPRKKIEVFCEMDGKKHGLSVVLSSLGS